MELPRLLETRCGASVDKVLDAQAMKEVSRISVRERQVCL